MTTGIFPDTSGRIGKRRLSIRERLAARQRDDFAELLAEGLTIADAAKVIGVGERRGQFILADIRKRLGWQAQ